VLFSGEAAVVGGGSVVDGCSAAKPQWADVMIFLGVVLRQEDSNRKKLPAPGSECSPEEERRRVVELRRSRRARR